MWDSRSFDTRSFDNRSWLLDARVQTLVKAGVSVFTGQAAVFLYSRDSLRVGVRTAVDSLTATYRDGVVRAKLSSLSLVVTKVAKRTSRPPMRAVNEARRPEETSSAVSVASGQAGVFVSTDGAATASYTKPSETSTLLKENKVFVTRKPRRDALKST